MSAIPPPFNEPHFLIPLAALVVLFNLLIILGSGRWTPARVEGTVMAISFLILAVVVAFIAAHQRSFMGFGAAGLCLLTAALLWQAQRSPNQERLKMNVAVVNAFTKSPSGGNPAGVCLLDAPLPEAEMQRIATEMNLAETAFIERQGEGYSIRWFTPTTEVPLCGHATLASAHLMWERGAVPMNQAIVFQSKSGPLTATCDGEWIALDFPADPSEPMDEPAGLSAALGIEVLSVNRSRVALIADLRDAAAVRSLTPDIEAIGRICPGVIVTAVSDDSAFDFVSRFFGPGFGIPEDPVTGAAHCALAPLWAERLGKSRMTAHQASARGGVVRLRVEGDRVELGGQAITIR